MKLLSMSGLVPEQICDTVRFTGYPGDRPVAHYCGYAADFISMARQEDDLDGAVFPKSCDSSRILGNYLADSGKFVYRLGIPPRQDQAAVEYFARELQDYRRALENHFHVSITDARICERAEAVNMRRKELCRLYDSLEGIAYGTYLRAVHRMLRTPLLEQKAPEHFDGTAESGAKRVYLVGSTLCNEKIADRIEESGMKVVGDDLPESGRLCAQPDVETGADVFSGIAASVLRGRLSPTQDNFGEILKTDLAEIERKAVQGVLFVTQKYCEPYDYLFYVYKKRLDAKGIPAEKIVLTNSMDDRDAAAAIEAFADMLGGG